MASAFNTTENPKNTKDGLKTVAAFGFLADVTTGGPLLLSEMTLLTALRTASDFGHGGQIPSTQKAIEGAEIITTCIADEQYAKILTDNIVGSGAHINAISGDFSGKTELHPEILFRPDIFVEFPPQTWIEGAIQQLPVDCPVQQLWKVITAKQSGGTRTLKSPFSKAWGSPSRISHRCAIFLI